MSMDLVTSPHYGYAIWMRCATSQPTLILPASSFSTQSGLPAPEETLPPRLFMLGDEADEVLENGMTKEAVGALKWLTGYAEVTRSSDRMK